MWVCGAGEEGSSMMATLALGQSRGQLALIRKTGTGHQVRKGHAGLDHSEGRLKVSTYRV